MAEKIDLETLANINGIEKANRRAFFDGYKLGCTGQTGGMLNLLRHAHSRLKVVATSNERKLPSGITISQVIDYITGWAAGCWQNDGVAPKDFAAGVYEAVFNHPNNDLSPSYRKGYAFGIKLENIK